MVNMDENLMALTIGFLLMPYIFLYIFKDMVVNNKEWRKLFNR